MYFGVYTDDKETASETYTDYKWTRIKGEQGIQGPQGVPGKDGASGKTSYFHIKYSAVAKPTSSSQLSETPSDYIGTYVDFTEADSTDPNKYTWSQFKGSQGDKGIAGTNGTNGKTSYLHIAYATSSDGKTGFSVSESAGKTYIGQYTDFTESDSTDYTKYSWTLIKGDKGDTGQGYNKNLIYNGDAMLGTDGWVAQYSSSKLSDDVPDELKKKGITYSFAGTFTSKKTIDINANGYYDLSVWMKNEDTSKKYYFAMTPYDADGNRITPPCCDVGMGQTYLAKDLNPGDTVVYLEDASKWHTGDQPYFYLLIFGYKNKFGYTYPDYTYSRNLIKICTFGDDKTKFIDVVNNTVTLKDAYTGATIPKGTAVSQSKDAGWLLYPFIMGPNTSWTHYTYHGKLFQIFTDYSHAINFFDHIDVITSIYGIGDQKIANLEFYASSKYTDDEIGNSAKSVEYYYLASSNSTAPLTSDIGWSKTPQQMSETNKYLWSYRKITTLDGSITTTTPVITGTYGQKGDTGTQGPRGPSGISVTSVVIQYYLSTSSTSMTGGSWSADYPKWEPNKWVWIRQETTLSDGTKKYSDGKLWSNLNELYELETSNSAEIINTNDSIKSTVEQVNTYHSELSDAIKSNTDALDAFKANVSGTYATKSEIAQTSQSIQASIKKAISDSTYQTVSNVKLDESGLHVGTSNTQTESKIDGSGLIVLDADGNILMNVTTTQSMIQNLKVTEKGQFGAHQIQAYDGEEADGSTVVGTALLWIGDVK